MGWIYKIIIYSAIILFCSAHTPNFSQPIKNFQETKKIYFSVFESPTKSDITYIKMFSSKKGIAIGNYFLEFNGKVWSLDQKKSELNSIRGVFAKDENHIYLANGLYTLYSSELLFYDDRNWKNIYNPFSNAILCIYVTDKNNVWLAGDREISFRKNNKWTKLPYPPDLLASSQIYGNDEAQAWNRIGDKLFFFNNSVWTQHLQNKNVISVDFENINHGFALVGNKIFEFADGNWKVYLKDESLKYVQKIYYQKPNRIWGLGTNGFVSLSDGNKCSMLDFPIKENLTCISFISNDEGWIAGENGALVHFSDRKISKSKVQKLGFNAITPFAYGKNLDDEYGVAIDDINKDGLKDIFSVCLYDPNRLYINYIVASKIRMGDIPFRDEAAKRNVSGVSESESVGYIPKLHLGIGLADIENDDDLDVYICSLNEPNKILLNDGQGFFRDVSHQPNRAADISERTNSAIFGDLNNDGNLDLLITNEYSTNRLFINDGNGYFNEITKDAGLTSAGGSMGASFADIDGDGLLDLFVANWARKNDLYKNISKNGKVKFANITDEAGVGDDAYKKSNGVCFADYNNDGLLDLFVTNRGASNRLYQNKGNDKFEDVTEQLIGLDPMLSYGASFADFDNDGFLDLYVANVGENVLYKNIDGNKFVDVTIKYGAELSGYGTGTATGDIDNDGDVDLFCANYTGGSSLLFVNVIDNKNFITIDIKGTLSNRDAIGTKIWLYTSGHAGDKNYLLGFREINGGNSYGSRSSTQIHFGVKANQTYDIVIIFPSSGIKKVLTSIKAGSQIKLFEEDGFSKTVTYSKKSILRFVKNRENQIEFLKFFIVVLIVTFSINRGKKKYDWNIGFSTISHIIVIASYITLIFLLLYREFSLSTILPLSFVLIYVFLLHLIFERVVFAKRIKEEKQKARDKIARDLHDDLASTLSSGLIYADALTRSIKNEEQKEKDLADKVKSLLNEATESITDLVWTVSPSHDKLKDLVARLRLFITDACKTNNIICEIKIDPFESDLSIPEEVRKNIYLIFKEAMNNIILHANAKVVIFTVQHNNGSFDISLHDDGNGFNLDKYQLDKESISDEKKLGSLHGNGILNMFKRARELNAILEIDSTKDSGTKILLKYKMT